MKKANARFTSLLLSASCLTLNLFSLSATTHYSKDLNKKGIFQSKKAKTPLAAKTMELVNELIRNHPEIMRELFVAGAKFKQLIPADNNASDYLNVAQKGVKAVSDVAQHIPFKEFFKSISSKEVSKIIKELVEESLKQHHDLKRPYVILEYLEPKNNLDIETFLKKKLDTEQRRQQLYNEITYFINDVTESLGTEALAAFNENVSEDDKKSFETVIDHIQDTVKS